MVFLFFGIFFLFNFISKNYKDKYFCNNWDKGINNTYILNDETIYPCTINIPKKKCFIDIFSPLLDFSKIFHIKCEKRKEKEKYLLKINSNLRNITKIKKIGFPKTIGDKEEIVGEPALYSDTLLYYVQNNFTFLYFNKFKIYLYKIKLLII